MVAKNDDNRTKCCKKCKQQFPLEMFWTKDKKKGGVRERVKCKMCNHYGSGFTTKDDGRKEPQANGATKCCKNCKKE